MSAERLDVLKARHAVWKASVKTTRRPPVFKVRPCRICEREFMPNSAPQRQCEDCRETAERLSKDEHCLAAAAANGHLWDCNIDDAVKQLQGGQQYTVDVQESIEMVDRDVICHPTKKPEKQARLLRQTPLLGPGK